MARTGKSKRSSASLPLRVWVSRGILIAQSITTACLGVIGGLVALLLISTGAKWLPLGVATLGGSVVSLGVAFGLWKLRSTVAQISGRWALATGTIELILFFIGISFLKLIGSAPQSSQGTDGPFTDGGAGAFSLAAYVYIAGGLVIALLIWDYARQARSHHRP